MNKTTFDIHPGIRTMVPAVRISNITSRCLSAPRGSFVECGVWRGGCLAVMASIAAAEGKCRKVYGFDSFEGLPEQSAPDERDGEEYVGLCEATLQDVHETFSAWGVSMDDTTLVPGWFKDTVPETSKDMGPIAVLRLDGDWYESTMTCLEHLYPLVVPGGVVIIDDYTTWKGCTKAVDEYRSQHGIDATLMETDPIGEVWWTKE